MYVYLRSLAIFDPRSRETARTTQAVLIFEGSDHAFFSWEADACVPLAECRGIAVRDYPLEVTVETTDGIQYHGMAFLRREERSGTEAHYVLAGAGHLVSASGDPF